MTPHEVRARHEYDNAKRVALSTAMNYEAVLRSSGQDNRVVLALIGAYLLARASWASNAACGEPDCACVAEVGDFRDEAQLLLEEVLDDVELIEMQAEGRA